MKRNNGAGAFRLDHAHCALKLPAPRSRLTKNVREQIEAEGSGAVVALHAAAPNSLSRSADVRSGKPPSAGPEFRSYGIGAQILAALGIHQMVLLTNTHHSPVALSGYGLEIVEERPIEGAN